MFLYHIFAYRTFVSVFGDANVWVRVPATTIGAVVFGTASFYLVERKFLCLKSRFMAKDHMPQLAHASLVPKQAADHIRNQNVVVTARQALGEQSS